MSVLLFIHNQNRLEEEKNNRDWKLEQRKTNRDMHKDYMKVYEELKKYFEKTNHRNYFDDMGKFDYFHGEIYMEDKTKKIMMNL